VNNPATLVGQCEIIVSLTREKNIFIKPMLCDQENQYGPLYEVVMCFSAIVITIFSGGSSG
jgi:hypothetical protein